MASILKVDTIQDQSGNNIINESADTITIGASGDTVNIVGRLQNGGTNFLQGITMADQWRLTVTLTGTDGDITANLERVDDATFSKIGTGMTESSGIFTFPSTGLYQVTQSLTMTAVSDSRASVYALTSSNSGSTYDEVARTDITSSTSASVRATSSQTTFVNVTNASTFRVKFQTNSFAPSSNVVGSTDYTVSSFTFIRLGDSV